MFAPTMVQEMTLEEYEKVLEEKRKALLALKAEERKVEIDKELQSMQQLSVKKDADEVFIKLVRYIACILLFPFFLLVTVGFDFHPNDYPNNCRALTRT
jgi:hypothetical protein